jgi:hypothetical protein
VRNSYGGTAPSGTLCAAFHEKQRPDHLPIIEALLTAGAQVEPDWQQEIAELRSRANGKGEQS